MDKILPNHTLSLSFIWTIVIVLIKTSNIATAPYEESRSESITTSSYCVQRLTSYDIAGNLGKFIEHEERRLRIITNVSRYEDELPFVKRRLQEFKIIHEDLVKNVSDKEFRKSFKGNHPTTIFAALRNFVAAWEDKLANTTIYGKRLAEFLEANDTKPLPTRNDLGLAGRGLTVIQATYNLSMADLLKGQVLGEKGEPLSPADCYDIGKTVLEAGLLDTAHEWLEMAVNSTDLEKVEPSQLTFNLSDALAALAKIAYKKKDQGKALKLFEKAVELDPENLLVYQEYVKHRFGRDVDPISELDREKVEPWRKKFFDMCQNSTNTTWLQEQEKLLLAANLKCRLRPSKTVPYQRYKEEILSKSPYISLILDFMKEKEIERVKNVTLDKLTETILPGNDRYTLWQYKGGWFKDQQSDILRQISERIGDVTGLNVSQSDFSSLGEPLHVVDFGMAGLALPHGDSQKKYHPKYMGTIGKRLATVHIYLSDVTVGGATVFIEQNRTVIPRKGLAVLWYNFTPSGDPETKMLSGTCPLAVGENIVLEKGIWRPPNDPTAFCGRRAKSTHYTAGMMVRKNASETNPTGENATETNPTETEPDATETE